MRVKTLLELLSISSSVYMISKDEEFFNRLGKMVEKGKDKISDLTEEFTGAAEEDQLLNKLIEKAKQAKEEFDHKMEEVAKKVYDKMSIAHTDQVEALQLDIAKLKKELATAESRIVALEADQV